MNRRHFLHTAPALFALPGTLRPAAPLRVALIGSGWYGKNDLLRLLQVAEVEVAGMCDVDSRMLKEAAALVRQRFPSQQPRLFADHRRMLAETKPELVLIATPDHWHALQAIDALEAGAHLYLQKPVGVDVRECEAVWDAARRHDRVVQVALQRRSTPHLVEAKRDYVDAGKLGKIGHVDMCCYYKMRDDKVREVEPVPDFFDYDRWTGPAPLLPYKGLPHRRWRAFQEYGNGIVGDMCVHMFDTVRWMLGLGWPHRIGSTGGIFVQKEADATTTDTQEVLFQYPQLTCRWQHRSWGESGNKDWPWSLTVYGTEGTLAADVRKYEFTPRGGEPVRVEATYERDKFPEDVDEEDIELHAAPGTRAHLRDLLGCIAHGGRPVADIEEGVISSVSCILGNVALAAGQDLEYDPRARTLRGGVDDGWLARTYREGYVHP